MDPLGKKMLNEQSKIRRIMPAAIEWRKSNEKHQIFIMILPKELIATGSAGRPQRFPPDASG